MAPKSRGRVPERAKTDESLRAERLNTDDALKGDVASAERDADEVVEEARDAADDVLSSARLKADREASKNGRPVEKGVVAGERAKADHAVSVERAKADVVLSTDREDQAETLAALLVHERAATDAFLLTERARSDDAVTNRDDFLGMVAHDVRNLLNAIVLNLELLDPSAGRAARAPAPADPANRIRRYVARMNRLIGDLVDVTSIDAGKLAMAPVAGDAVALVAEATETFQPAAREKGVTLAAALPAASLPAEFDHDRLLQVLANLLANGIKFTPRGGAIAVRVEVVRGTLRFCVSDTGAGIPAGMLEAIFERFWQVDGHDKRGQGLGLYISKCIVEAHHGRIWAESEVGKGTQLYFTIRSRPAVAPRRRRRKTGKADRRG